MATLASYLNAQVQYTPAWSHETLLDGTSVVPASFRALVLRLLEARQTNAVGYFTVLSDTGVSVVVRSNKSSCQK